jgi:hypothetical protein
VLAAIGAGFAIDANATYSRLNDSTQWPTYDLATAEALSSHGKGSQTLSAVLVSVGAVALIAGVVWLLLVRS